MYSYILILFVDFLIHVYEFDRLNLILSIRHIFYSILTYRVEYMSNRHIFRFNIHIFSIII